ncbi:MAG: S8 family serine peptidase [Anaerolineales bacterium]|nr:S8 family serine peptidase [Anaerolineales bacterium]
MHSKPFKILSLLLAFVMLVPLVAMPVGAGAAAVEQSNAPLTNPQPAQNSRANREDVEMVQESKDLALSKIDPLLLDAAQDGGKEMVDLYVSVQHGTDLSQYMKNMYVRPMIFGGTQNVYGQAAAGNLLKIAGVKGVVALVKVGAELEDMPYDIESEDATTRELDLSRLEELRANEVPWSETQAGREAEEVEGWFDVRDGHQSKAAWNKGFTGEGVIVGVLDDGIDFAHPDLQGTYARVTDEYSPYYGWPMAFSQISLLYFFQDLYFDVAGIAENWGGSRWTDAQTTRTAVAGKVNYQPVMASSAHNYTVPGTSKSGQYKLGSHPDRWLRAAYGENVAVLVVDEHTAGVYDTVYVDLDNDYSFADEKPNTKESPEVYRDMDGDGYADISGGLLVWISDSANVPPAADWLWGISCAWESTTMKGCPDSGELVLFAGPFETGTTSSHGTLCGSNIAAQGVIDGGLSTQPFTVGGVVRGGAPDVGLMDFGNHYYQGTDEDEYLVAALGYDGWENTGDEVQITSNSYGNFTQMWGSWGYYGRLISALNNTVAPDTTWVFSVGNEGPGYGPQEGDGSPTALMVGSSTQYGSTGWDSIMDADQIVYGDPSSFYSHGPNRDGSTGVDVLANGGRGSGDQNLNYLFDGETAWETWGGTSRSGPVAAGNLALVYQAYKDRYGVWPTWDVAKTLIKSGADNNVSSPFFQGGGVLNADRATDLAAGIYGVYATPDEWQVGDWEGVEYLNFAKVAYPGETYNKTYTVDNPSNYDISVSLSEGVMELMASHEYSFTTSDQSVESAFNFHTPDYLMQMDDSIIPADAEVMIVRYVHSYDSFDPVHDYTPLPNSSWRFLLYNWTDQNSDGELWIDANANGAVNHADDVAAGLDNDEFFRPDFITTTTEIQQGEYIRMDYEFGGLAVPIIVHEPLERMADGYFFGFQHRYNDGTVPTTTFEIGVEFYKRADWDWLTLSDANLNIAAQDSETFDAQIDVPGDAAPGTYEGVIFMDDPGDCCNGAHPAHETALPIIVNVIAEIPDGGSVTLGGGPMEDTLYQNSHTFGYFNWYGGGWTGAGEWRHFFLEVDENDYDAGNLLIHTSWENVPTDINTWVLGPTEDCASNGEEPCAWFEPGWTQPDQSIFGPYTLLPIASSGTFLPGSAYPFDTSTGGPDDWLKVPLEQDGLHEIALHNVLYSGDDFSEQFQVDVGTIEMEPVMDIDDGIAWLSSIDALAFNDTGKIELQFTSSLELPDLNAWLTGGLSMSHVDDDVVLPDSGQCDDGAWCADTQWFTVEVDAAGTTNLRVYVTMPGGEDVDLFVYYDENNNDVADNGTDTLMAASTNPAGTDDFVDIANPDLGTYLVGILGWDVSDNLLVDWYYEITAPGALATDPVDVYSNTVAIGQDTAVDFTTASYSMTVTANNRVAALNAQLTDIPTGANVDLYVTDIGGTVLVSSTNALCADEQVLLTPLDANYRFEEGSKYVIWVHGVNVPTPPINPHLHVWWDQLNLWLSAEHPDVNVRSIGAGEMVSMTLHFDKPGWSEGDPDLSARLIAGPTVLPLAFDELVVISRLELEVPTEWDPYYLDVTMTAVSSRGPSPKAKWSTTAKGPISTALIAPGERVTYTVRVENDDPLFDSPSLELRSVPLPEDYICTYYGPADPVTYCGDQADGSSYGLIDGPAGIINTGTSISLTTDIPSGDYVEYSFWVEMAPDMALGKNSTAGVRVYLGATRIAWMIAGGYYLPHEGYLDGYKLSEPYPVLPGDTFTYTFYLENPSAEDLNLYIDDPLPAEVTYVSNTGDAVYVPGTHSITWQGALDGNAWSEVEFYVQVQANTDLVFDTLIENEAEVGIVGEVDPLFYMYDINWITTGADLVIEKSVDSNMIDVGDVFTYTIVFSNIGIEEAAKDVHMEDPIPDYLLIDEATITASKPSAGLLYEDGVVQWDGDLAIGESVTVTFQASLSPAVYEEFAVINLASVTAENYPWPVYSSALSEAYSAGCGPVSAVRIYLPIVVRQ